MPEEFSEGGFPPHGSANAEDGAPVAKRPLSLTWMILLPLLAVAIGMLASDVFRGRLPQDAAFKRVNAKLVQEPADDSEDQPGGGFGGRRGGNQAQPLTAEAVHKLLGREPDLVENRRGNLNGKDDPDAQMEPVVVETYKFPGIIENYEVVVTYATTSAGDNKPATTALKFVRKDIDKGTRQ